MPAVDLAAGTVRNAKGWVYTSSTDFAKDGVHLCREDIKHPCHPLVGCMQLWPEKPTKYREVVGTYLVQIRKLSLRVLEMICKGPGLQPDYFEDSSQVQLLSIISNGKCRSAEHRAVTNSSEGRISIATFINPSFECIVEPAKVLMNGLDPPRYKSTSYRKFVSNSNALGPYTKSLQSGVCSES